MPNMDAKRMAAHNLAACRFEGVGEKRAETNKRKRQFREALKYIMEAELPTDDDIREEMENLGFDQIDYQSAMLYGQIKRAVYGADTDAAKFVRDTAGYKPTDAVQVGSLDDGLQINLGGLSDEQLMQMIAEKTDLA